LIIQTILLEPSRSTPSIRLVVEGRRFESDLVLNNSRSEHR